MTVQAPPGTVTFVTGPVRSGKSRFAAELARTLGTTVVPALPAHLDRGRTSSLFDRAADDHRVLVVDDAHFLTGPQVDQLVEIVDASALTVWLIGLTSSFTGDLFHGVVRIIARSDRIVHGSTTECWCGRPATHQLRLVDGTVTRHGPLFVHTSELGPHLTHEPVCAHHHRHPDRPLSSLVPAPATGA